eukprot:SAG22_NODE_277_length_13166_cov_134.125277_7_plen_78_part_00
MVGGAAGMARGGEGERETGGGGVEGEAAPVAEEGRGESWSSRQRAARLDTRCSSPIGTATIEKTSAPESAMPSWNKS